MALTNVMNQAHILMEISNDFRCQANELQHILDETKLTYSGKDADIYCVALRNIIAELTSIANEADSISQRMISYSTVI